MDYDSDNTISDREGIELTDHTDRSLITDISRSLNYISGESRAKRQQQQLLEALVREHIEDKQHAPSFLKSMLLKLSRH